MVCGSRNLGKGRARKHNNYSRKGPGKEYLCYNNIKDFFFSVNLNYKLFHNVQQKVGVEGGMGWGMGGVWELEGSPIKPCQSLPLEHPPLVKDRYQNYVHIQSRAG